LAGYTFLMRYVGLTLVVAVAIGFIGQVLLRRVTVKDFLKTAVFYGLGFGLVVLPYIIRNLVAFGTIQPYRLPLQGTPFMFNLRDYLVGLGQMIFAAPSFGGVMVVILVGIAGILVMTCVKNREVYKRPSFYYVLILSAYFLLNSILLVSYWSRYYSPEKINSRYLIQIAWILTGAIVYGSNNLLVKLFRSKPEDKKAVAGLLILSFVVVQVFPVSDFYFAQKTNRDLARKVQSHVSWIQSLPNDYAVMSNVVDMSSYYSKRNIRALEYYAPNDLLYVFDKKRRFAVFLVKDDGSLASNLRYSPQWKRPFGYRRIFADEAADLLVPQGK